MSITYLNNEYGDVLLADGRHVRLTQAAYCDNYDGRPAWFARGYLSTETYLRGPTVQVRWDSLGADEAEDDADWDHPDAVHHYSLGRLD